jgi:hypothetical protein
MVIYMAFRLMNPYYAVTTAWEHVAMWIHDLMFYVFSFRIIVWLFGPHIIYAPHEDDDDDEKRK